jgi:hypothetical protein
MFKVMFLFLVLWFSIFAGTNWFLQPGFPQYVPILSGWNAAGLAAIIGGILVLGRAWSGSK